MKAIKYLIVALIAMLSMGCSTGPKTHTVELYADAYFVAYAPQGTGEITEEYPNGTTFVHIYEVTGSHLVHFAIVDGKCAIAVDGKVVEATASEHATACSYRIPA